MTVRERRILFWSLLLLAMLVLAFCTGLLFPVQAAFWILMGWIPFTARTLPEITVAWGNVALAAICLALFTGGLHWFMTWFVAASRRDATSCEDGTPPKEPATVVTPWKWGWTARSVTLLLVMFVAGIAMVGISHQFIWMAKDPLFNPWSAAMRMRIGSNLSQMGLATQNYVDKYRSLPVGTLRDARGMPLHGWQTQLLPFMEQEQLYSRIDFAKRWDDAAQGDVFRTEVPIYTSRPSGGLAPPGEYARTDYAGNLRLLGTRTARTLLQIKGTHETILAGEVSVGRQPWGRPGNLRDPAKGLRDEPDCFHGQVRESRGAMFVMVDGSYSFISDDVDPQVLKQLATP